MTRTTIDLDPSVLAQLRDASRHAGRPMGAVASEVLARGLAEGPPASAPPLRWNRRDMGQPTIDLEDREAVRAILDRR